MSAVTVEVACVPALSDNYIWIVHEPRSGATAIVDPAVAAPAQAAVERREWRVSAIWNTHWHPDHTGGNAAAKAATGASITGPRDEAARIPTLDRLVSGGDTLHLGELAVQVLDVPGHTAGHVAFYLPEAGVAFVGDTLFAMGCGRLFEGTPAQMHASLATLMALPDATQVYCAHEYTEANARFALHVEPANQAVRARAAQVRAARARGEPTVPTTIGEERATNPFVRVASAAEFAERRAAKDAFRG